MAPLFQLCCQLYNDLFWAGFTPCLQLSMVDTLLHCQDLSRGLQLNLDYTFNNILPPKKPHVLTCQIVLKTGHKVCNVQDYEGHSHICIMAQIP